ncbi:uncharacterized protein LOC108670732 [Hyalella azteca]|uniref:Uncharacterized protein LOC108670732 n=1 Tax=Hyalella azteca TaxID=294128 RepID=A0A8B7NJ86_HYAAZ|nr:uncharacterized protein LOC108670732 [Hyalella azteca]
MLHHAKPQLLWVDMPVFAQKEAQWVEFLKVTGSAELTLSNLNEHGNPFDPVYLCDDLLQYLPESRVRLNGFHGYVRQSGATALAAMARRSQRDIRLNIDGMPTETTKANWGLILKPATDDINFQMKIEIDSSYTRPPSLDIDAYDDCNAQDLANAIIFMAPQDKRFSVLFLAWRELSTDDLRDLLQRLQDGGIRTSDYWEAHVASLTRAAVSFNEYYKGFELYIGDQMSPEDLLLQIDSGLEDEELEDEELEDAELESLDEMSIG